MAENGVTIVYDEVSNQHETREAWMRSLRAGDVGAVVWLCLLADDIGNVTVKRNDLKDVLSEIELRGASVWELGSGLRSSDPKQRDQMISVAWDGLAKGRVPRDKPPGRPKRVYSEAELEIIWAEWHSKKHEVNKDAAIAASQKLGKKISANAMWRVIKDMRKTREADASWIGGSGRKAGRRDPVWEKHKAQVYFVQHGDTPRVKIGTSTRINGRLSGLKGGSPDKLKLLATVSGSFEAEARLHKRFAKFRIAGEWYKLEGALAEYVTRLGKPKKPMT